MGRKSHLALLREFKRKLGHHTKIEQMILFGSRARGKAREWSDFDLIVVSKAFEGKRFRYRALGFRKEWDLNYPVDFLCYTPKEFRTLAKEPSVVSEALREGISI